MRIKAIAQELIKRGWAPVTSNLSQYIGTIMYQNREHFEPLKPRGAYRVRSGAPRVRAAIAKRFPVGRVKQDVFGIQQCSKCHKLGHNARGCKTSKPKPKSPDWQTLARKAGWMPPKARKVVVSLLASPTSTDQEFSEAVTRIQDAVRGAVREPIFRVSFEALSG